MRDKNSPDSDDDDDDDDDDDSNEEDEDDKMVEDNREAINHEILMLQYLLKNKNKNGQSCPFTAPDKAVPALQCPFEFGLKEGADSEEEADLPKQHKHLKRCPHQWQKCKDDGETRVETSHQQAQDGTAGSQTGQQPVQS